jgi:hypothetical protein
MAIMEQEEQRVMTLFEAEAHSFVLRIWRENRDDPTVDAEWRGWIEHVQSGRRTYFRELQEIEQLLAEYMSADNDPVESLFMPLRPRKNVG